MPQKQDDGTEIPSTIKRSDRHAQHIWKKAHDSAAETYGEGGRAHRAAYAALKHEYEKRGDKWVQKSGSGPSDPQAARGPTTKRKSTDKPASTGGGKTARNEKQARQKARQSHKETAEARQRSKRAS